MKIVTLCGSLRAESSNAYLLKGLIKLRPEIVWVPLDLSQLPYFEPERQYDNVPELVKTFRNEVAGADTLLIATPEYAHAMPGLLKNGLEWIFCDQTLQKKVVVLISSAQGENTREQLMEVLKTMDFQVKLEWMLILKNMRNRVDQEGNFLDPLLLSELQNFTASL